MYEMLKTMIIKQKAWTSNYVVKMSSSNMVKMFLESECFVFYYLPITFLYDGHTVL